MPTLAIARADANPAALNVPVLPVLQQTQAVKDVMARVIDENLQRGTLVSGQNIQFAMFCFEREELCDNLLEGWFVKVLNATTNSRARYL